MPSLFFSGGGGEREKEKGRGLNPQRRKHPSSREKIVELCVEAHISLNTADFITCKTAQACSLFLLSEDHWASGDTNCHFSACLFIHIHAFSSGGSVVTHWASPRDHLHVVGMLRFLFLT